MQLLSITGPTPSSTNLIPTSKKDLSEVDHRAYRIAIPVFIFLAVPIAIYKIGFLAVLGAGVGIIALTLLMLKCRFNLNESKYEDKKEKGIVSIKTSSQPKKEMENGFEPCSIEYFYDQKGFTKKQILDVHAQAILNNINTFKTHTPEQINEMLDNLSLEILALIPGEKLYLLTNESLKKYAECFFPSFSTGTIARRFQKSHDVFDKKGNMTGIEIKILVEMTPEEIKAIAFDQKSINLAKFELLSGDQRSLIKKKLSKDNQELLSI